MSLWSSLLSAGIVAIILMKVTSILLAAIGGAITDQANVLNIGLEGMMLIGAFSAIAVGAAFHSWIVGVFAAMLAGMILGLVFAVCSLWLKADFIVVGIGINLLAAGLTMFLLNQLYGTPGVTPPNVKVTMPPVSLGPLANVPFIGAAFNNLTPLVWFALIAVPIYALVLYRTRFGVHLRAVGQDEPAAVAAGINPNRIRLAAILASGALAGIAGAQLSMASLGSYNTNMTSGRGFIAVAALTFGRSRPLPTFIAALIFGIADAVSDRMNVTGVLNSNIALMLPYIITVIALTLAAITAARRRRGAVVSA